MNYLKYILALTVLLSAVPAMAQNSNRFINLPLEVLAETWLTRNCGIDEELRLEAAVAQRGGALEPIFMSAWREGPPEEQIRETSNAAAERYQRNRELLDDPESLGLTNENLARYKSQSEEGFVTRTVENFNFGYRSQALRGLLFTGGDAGREVVEATATDIQSPFNSIARLALSRSDEN